MKAIVVAMDQNRGIGAENDLLWLRDMPSDLEHFRKITTGGTVIMGRKTFESIGKPLPDRENIVVSRTPTGVQGVHTAVSLDSAYTLARYDIYVIGGGQIYSQAINDMDRLYVTEIHETFPQATVFFPEIDLQVWKEVSRERHETDERNKYAYTFVTYDRIDNEQA